MFISMWKVRVPICANQANVPDIKHSIAVSAKVHQQHGLTSYVMLMLATQGFDLVHLLPSQPVRQDEFWIME